MNKSISEIFFTIVIPTRERSDTLTHAIKTALSQDYENFRVLVSDNASQDQTKEKVEALKDPRIHYINTGHRVSMSENWEFALNHVSDGWLTVLGDDDGILPGTLRLVNQLIEETGVKAIRSNGCSYSWPGTSAGYYGKLSIIANRGYEIRKSKQFLQRVMDGKISYTELPVLYNGGFVSTDLIATAKKVTGKFFHSMTPDVYSGIVFSHLTEEYLYSNEPLAINGASIHSGGTAAFEKKKIKRSYDPAEKYWKEPNIPFHEDLPLMHSGRPVRSIPVLIYEAYLQAKDFHDLKLISVSKSSQLATTLAKSGPDPREIMEWTGLFCAKHNVEMPNYSLIRFRAFKDRFSGFLVRLKRGLYSSRVTGSTRVPLQNVFEASLVAGFIKDDQPSLLHRIRSRIKKVEN